MTESGFNPAEDLPVYVIAKAGIEGGAIATGGGRRYSARDIALLREVQRLSTEGVNLEGIRRVLDLEDEVAGLRRRVAQLESERTSGALVVWRPTMRR